MKRITSVIGLAPENRTVYKKLHVKAWPTVLDRITRSGIRNYSIYRHGDLLFSYFEYVGDNFDVDMEAMSDDEETQRW